MTSSQPFVSAVMAAYNYEGYVAEALESALAQDYPADRLEVIVVDDGSTDGTSEIANGYAERFGGRIRYIRQDNAGLAAATSRGLQEARGELITLLDADDVWLASRTQLLVAALSRNPKAGLVYGDMQVIDGDGRTIAESWLEEARQTPFRGLVAAHLLRSNFVIAPSMMVRASLKERFCRSVVLPRPGLVHRRARRRGGRDRLRPRRGGRLPAARREHEPRQGHGRRHRKAVSPRRGHAPVDARQPPRRRAHRRGSRRRLRLLLADPAVRRARRERPPRERRRRLGSGSRTCRRSPEGWTRRAGERRIHRCGGPFPGRVVVRSVRRAFPRRFGSFAPATGRARTAPPRRGSPTRARSRLSPEDGLRAPPGARVLRGSRTRARGPGPSAQRLYTRGRRRDSSRAPAGSSISAPARAASSSRCTRASRSWGSTTGRTSSWPGGGSRQRPGASTTSTRPARSRSRPSS